MIEIKEGRARSYRTLEEVEEAFQKDIESLSPEEKETLQILLQELQSASVVSPQQAQQAKNQNLLNVLSDAEYKWKPVSMEQFLSDPYYLGTTCDNVYPRLREDLIELFNGGYHECIFTGSIGWGKTFTASIGVARVLYELSCLRNPQASFGMAPGTNLSIVCLSVNETLATKVVFENISTKVRASKYFEENFSYEATKKEMRFPNNIWVAARATTDTSALGLNTISALVDETNFMPTKGGKANDRFGYVDHAEVIYNSIKRRMKSRFERKGKLPGMIFVVSSKKTSDDFTAKRVKDAQKDPSVFVRDYALWDVKPGDYYTAKKFHVLVGNEQIPSRILSSAEEMDVDTLRKELPEGAILMSVPEDFRVDFERDLEGAIRDLAGCATVAVSPFIQRREKVLEALEEDKKAFQHLYFTLGQQQTRHPFSALVHDPSRGGQFLWDRMVRLYTERAPGGGENKRMRPIINPNAPRHVHIDPSLRNDALGFCMAHIGGFKDVVRRNEITREQFLERAPIYVVDCVLRVVPPVGDEIILGDIRAMIYDLTKHGYMISRVTLDSYQSADCIQQLSQKGYQSEILSVDTSMDPYENFKTALYENRVLFYDYPPLIRELQQLERDMTKHKVDHPPRGSKDVSDALAGAFYSLNKNPSHPPLPILPGISYYGDTWMPEQLQAKAAGSPRANENQDLNRYNSVLPPFLLGGG